ncbi:MAG TPA: TetR/AcrR family transcriptional regulator [Solirubrobacterales bacterium]|jgi:AcrR family transcriptional regulator
MVELVAECGYDTFAVTTLASRARVSKRDFYKHFTGKEECFVASYDSIAGRSVRGIRAATEDQAEWRERLRLGILAFAGQIADNPGAAQLTLVEVFSASAAAVERMLCTNRLLEAMVAQNFALAEEAPNPPLLIVKGVVAGCAWVTRGRLLSDGRDPALDGSELAEWALRLCDEDLTRLHGLAAAAPCRPTDVPAAPLAKAPGDERRLILAATAKLASSEGYATLTAPRVRAAAGVSKRSFDRHFEGMPDCFLSMLGTLSGRILAGAEPFFRTADDWASGVQRMVAGLCQHLAQDPAFASLAFLETFSPGVEVVKWRCEMIARLASTLRRECPPAKRPTTLAAEASIGAMWGAIHHLVATGHSAQLPAAAPLLSYIALAPALGGPAAAEAVAAQAHSRRDR